MVNASRENAVEWSNVYLERSGIKRRKAGWKFPGKMSSHGSPGLYIYMSPSRVTQITFPSYPDVERVRRRVGPMSKEISSCSLLFLSSGCLSVCMYAWHWNGKLASITAGFTSSSTYLAITRVASRSKYRTSFILVGRTGLRNYRKIFCGVIR